jgi:hypothetical protein
VRGGHQDGAQVLDAEALLPDDDMPKVLDFDVLPDDNNNDVKWHGAAPFCLIFFCFFQKDMGDTLQLCPPQIFL